MTTFKSIARSIAQFTNSKFGIQSFTILGGLSPVREVGGPYRHL
jgi:hypothetical protein